MKKIIGIFAVIALAVSSVFAEINIGAGFNSALFVPAAKTADGEVQMATVSPFGQAPRIGISFSISNDKCGVEADIKFDGGEVSVNDNAYVWVKPISWIKVQIGQSFDDTLRGSYGFGSNDWLRPGNILNDDITFTRLCEPGVQSETVKGIIAIFDPLQGLHIAAALNTYYGQSSNGEAVICSALSVLRNAQVQAAYTIADIVQIKAQWIGWNKQINAAVALKAIEDMTLEAGIYIPVRKGDNIEIGAFWGMPVGPLTLKLNAKFFGESKIYGIVLDKGSFKSGFGAEYDFGNGIEVGADIVIAKSFNPDSDTEIAFAAWITKSIANAEFGIAFQGASHDTLRDFASSDFTFAVPLKISVQF